VRVLFLSQAQLRKDRVDVLFDGTLGEEELGRDRRVVLALGHEREDLVLTRR